MFEKNKANTATINLCLIPKRAESLSSLFVYIYNQHRDTDVPTPNNPKPGRRSSWVKLVLKVWMCVSVSEDPPTPGDTL